jgi:hypothetical protein
LLASAPELYFVKTHDLPPDDSPAIYIVRDGRDALVSLARYNRSFGRKPSVLRPVKDFIRFDRTLQQAILSDQYGGWSGNVNGWVQRKNGNRTYIIRYEELVKDPGGLLSKALQHFDLAIEPTGDALPDFGALHQKWPDFFRKGKTGSWREEMSEKNHSLFWQHHAKAMDLLGYAK